MDNFIEIRQINREEVLSLIQNLDNFEKDGAIKSGLKSAGNVFVSGGKQRLRRKMKSGHAGVTGNLLRSFTVRVKRRRLGVLAGFNQGVGGGSHANLIDLGTDRRYWKKPRKYTGRVRANRFWSDTEAQDYPKAMKALYAGIEKAVNRISNRR